MRIPGARSTPWHVAICAKCVAQASAGLTWSEPEGGATEALEPWPGQGYPRQVSDIEILDAGVLEPWLAEAIERTGVPGASLAVRHGDTLAHVEAGVVDVTSGCPVTADSAFQIGSTTKVLTAAVVLQLVDEGTIELDGTLGQYLGAFDVGGFDASDVTVRQLLDHTSGLPGHYFADFGPGPDSIGRYVDSLSTQHMIHPPGAMFSYCNAGYVVAGRLAEVASGELFRNLIRTRIAKPLGLRSTTTNLQDIAREHVAAGHEIGAGGKHELSALQTAAWSSAPAGSIMLSTAIELSKVGHALGSFTSSSMLVSDSSVDLMTKPSVELPCAYWGRRAQCLGWGYDDRGGTALLLHGGGTTGQSAMLLAVPQRHVTIALLTNSAQGGLLLGEAERWLMTNLGVPPSVSPPDPVHDLTDKQMAALVGTYTDIWTTTTVQREAEGLTLVRRIHASAVSPAIDLPPTPLKAIEPRLLTVGRGRPLLFMSVDPTGDDAPCEYVHQVNASRRTQPAPDY